MQVRPVLTRAELKQFIELPYRLYGKDPNWVPPLRSEQWAQFETRRNPMLDHCEYGLFLLLDERPIGRISAFVDRLAVEAWGEAARAHVPFVVHDADPLAEVGSAWVDRWDGAGDVGRLEVAVQAVLQRWRAGTLELPDYHLVVAPDDLSRTARHWYLGVLASEAPHRVVVVDDDHEALARAVRRLRAGRWWPDLAGLLAGLDRRVPDTFEVRPDERSLIV